MCTHQAEPLKFLSAGGNVESRGRHDADTIAKQEREEVLGETGRKVTRLNIRIYIDAVRHVEVIPMM